MRPLKNIPVTNVGSFFESIKGLYLHFGLSQRNRYFELWELINESWLATRGLGPDSPYKAKRILWAMTDYKNKRFKSHANQVSMESFDIDKRNSDGVRNFEPEATREITYDEIEDFCNSFNVISACHNRVSQ